MKKTPAGQREGALARGLRAALTNEIDGREFYRMAAANTGHDSVRQMFEFLMGEEERHRDVILDLLARLAKGKPLRLARKGAGGKGGRKFHSPLLTPDLLAAGGRAEGEAAALSIGMTLEKRAIDQFASLRKKTAGDPAAEELFDDLIAWEKEHLDMLAKQYAQIREMYWEEARFWPF